MKATHLGAPPRCTRFSSGPVRKLMKALFPAMPQACSLRLPAMRRSLRARIPRAKPSRAFFPGGADGCLFRVPALHWGRGLAPGEAMPKKTFLTILDNLEGYVCQILLVFFVIVLLLQIVLRPMGLPLLLDGGDGALFLCVVRLFRGVLRHTAVRPQPHDRPIQPLSPLGGGRVHVGGRRRVADLQRRHGGEEP